MGLSKSPIIVSNMTYQLEQQYGRALSLSHVMGRGENP